MIETDIKYVPDGVQFSETVEVEYMIEPDWGLTVGDQLQMASYNSHGEYELLGDAEVVKDGQGNLVIKGGPGVGVKTFSGLAWFEFAKNFMAQQYVFGAVVNKWTGGGYANIGVSIDLTRGVQGVSDNGGSFVLIKPPFSHYATRVIGFVPTNYFSTGTGGVRSSIFNLAGKI